MFGFGKRKKYNGAIDTKLNSEYQIKTRDNPSFPGVLAYLERIDGFWNANLSEDQGALILATVYYCGTVKAGDTSEAERLLQRINTVAASDVNKGLISETFWGACKRDIAAARNIRN